MASSKPAVLYIITQLDLGGAQKVCLSLYNNSQMQAYLASGNAGILKDTVKNDPHVFFIDSLAREITGRTVLQEVRSFFHLIRLICELKKKHPNLIVHTHSTKAGIIGRWAAFFARAPYRVHTIHAM